MSASPFLTITNDQVFIQTEENVLLRVFKNIVDSATSKDKKWEYFEEDGKIGIYSVEKDLTWEFDANEQPGVHKLEPKVEKKKKNEGPSKTSVAFCWGMCAGVALLFFCILISNGLRVNSPVVNQETKRLTCNGYGDYPGPPGFSLEVPKEKPKLPTIPRYAGVFPASKSRFSQRTYLDKNADYILEVTKFCDLIVLKDSKQFHEIFRHPFGFYQCYLKFQTDGNLVLYRSQDDEPMWSSGTHNQGYENMYYDVENKSFKFF